MSRALELPFSQSFAMEIALDFDTPAAVCDKHDVPIADYEELLEYKPFIEQVATYKKMWLSEGVTAETMAKMAVEDLIPVMNRMVKDIEIPAQVRKGAFDSLVAVSKLATGQASGSGNAFQVNIVLPAPTGQANALDVTPSMQALPKQKDELTLPDV